MNIKPTKNFWQALRLLGALLFLSACTTFIETHPQPTAPGSIPIIIPGVPREAPLLFAENCAACHGPAGEGGEIAPALNSAELRGRLNDSEIIQTITNGRPNTAMYAWKDRLSRVEIEALADLIRNWDKMDDDQIAAMAAQAEGCGSLQGMHHGIGHRGPMMEMGCSSRQTRDP